MFDTVLTDLRHSCRRLRHAPGLSLVVIATLALVLAANTTVFSLVNAILLRTVEASDPARLVAMSAIDTRTNQPTLLHASAIDALRTQSAFSALALYSGGSVFRIEGVAGTLDVGGEGVTPAYFDLLGAQPSAGRFFDDTDDGAGAAAVVVSDRLRRRMFGDSGSTLGVSIVIDGKPATIVGVTRPGFAGLQLDAGADLFMPLAFARGAPGDPASRLRAPNIIGRLAPGIALATARAEVLARWPNIVADTAASLATAEQDAARAQQLVIESAAGGFSILRRQYGTAALTLVGLTGLLLAVAAVNLMALMLAHAMAGRQELALRLALGTSRATLLWQRLLDGVLLAIVALVVAAPLAWGASQLLTAALSVARAIPLRQTLAPDVRVLAVAALVAVITGGTISAVAAWRALGRPTEDIVRQGRTIGSLGRIGRLILVTQIALSMVLLVGAGLFTGTLTSLQRNQAQLGPDPILWTRLARHPGDRGTTLGDPYFQQLIERLDAIPGADGAAFSLYFPGYLGFVGALRSDGFARAGDAAVPATVSGLTELVSPGFFDIFGIAMRRGRDFTWRDDRAAPAVAIVSETLATRLFPDGDAVGHHMRHSSGATNTDLEIVGVVADAPIGSLRDPHLAVVFRPLSQELARAQAPLAHVRVRGDLSTARDAYVRAVEMPQRHFVRALFTFDEWVDNALLQERLIAGVASAAAVMAVLLACLGIYGLLACTAAARVRDIGVRMALGATRGAVVRMVLREGLLVALGGVLLGTPCALGIAYALRTQLYGVAPTDPSIVAGAALLFVATALVAAIVPAWRASSIDPVDALRQE